MSFLLVSFDNQEIDRRDLDGAMVIGRCGDCDLAVRDVLLSRRHCRIAPCGESEWQVVDLASKNGTLHNGKPLNAPAVLKDGDELVLGRLTARFSAGTLAGANLTPLRAAPLRPADPNESLSGTCAGFGYLEPGQSPRVANLPCPRPAPRAPAAFEREDLYSLLSSIASSSWDSIYAENRRPLNAPASPRGELQSLRIVRHRPRSPVDLSLQVRHRGELRPVRRGIPRARRLAGSGVMFALIAALFVFKLCVGPNVTPAAAAAPAVIPPVPIVAAPSDMEIYVRAGASIPGLFY